MEEKRGKKNQITINAIANQFQTEYTAASFIAFVNHCLRKLPQRSARKTEG